MRILTTLITLVLFFCCPVAAQAAGGGSAPPGFALSRLNASVQPVTEDGVTTFKILPNDCSDIPYRPGDDESDCKMGSTKSQIFHEQMVKIGETVEYSFEVRVDPAFDYPGTFRNGLESLPFAPGAWDSDLRIASWEGPERKSFVFTMKLDATRGITFQERDCAPPSTFGTWVKFTMKIRWEHNNKGWVHATCDDRTVWIEEGAASARQAVCHMFNECQPGIIPKSKSFNFTLGFAMSGRGDDWKETGFDSKFVEFDPEGLTIQMRNMSQRKGVELYGPDDKAQVKLLQEKLNELGCEVGTPDGVVGPKTREQARLCRGFADREMPDALNVATLETFVDLYSRDGVAALPPGSMPVPPAYTIHIASRDDNHPSGPQTIYSFNALIERPGKEMMPINYIIIGQFNPGTRNFRQLEVLLDDIDVGDRGEKELGACSNNRVEENDGMRRLVLNFSSPDKDVFRLRNFDCVLEALPVGVAEKAEFLVKHFAEMAATLVDQGSAERIANEYAKTFMTRVAAGEIGLTYEE